MICDIAASWCESEFEPSLRSYLYSRKLEEKALLLLDHCPTLNTVLADIPEAMSWLESQTDSEDLHSLHLTRIKHYVL
jgi:hypothetical protein